jgi:predicted PurR-regulated permease PerM
VWLVLGLLALLVALNAVRGVAITVVFVGVVAFLCEPLVVRLERRGLGRSAGAGCRYGHLSHRADEGLSVL